MLCVQNTFDLSVHDKQMRQTEIGASTSTHNEGDKGRDDWVEAPM